jgi:hypothetical protein
LLSVEEPRPLNAGASKLFKRWILIARKLKIIRSLACGIFTSGACMQLKPFLLDAWFDQYERDIEFNLAASPGPIWAAFPWLVSGASDRRFWQSAAEHGILIAPGDCFDVPSHFRLGFAVV